MAGASSLASIEDIEGLWRLLQEEIYESGRVSRFDATVTVISADGQQERRRSSVSVTFNMCPENGYLKVGEEASC